MTPPLSHPSPSVRALQAQFLHPAAATTNHSRPRRASAVTAVSAPKRRRCVESQSDESVHSADWSGEEEEEEEEEDSDFTGEESTTPPTTKRAKTSARTKPLSSLDAQEKRLRRQQQNRDAAATSRNRKKQHLAMLEQRSATLEAENHHLKQQLRDQQKQIALMQLQLGALTHAHPHRTIVPTEQVRRYSAPSSPDSDFVHTSAPTTPVEDSSVGSSPTIVPAQLNVTVAPLALDEDLVEQHNLDSLAHSPKFTQKTVSLPTLPFHTLPPVASLSMPITHRMEHSSPAAVLPSHSPYSNVFAAEFTRDQTLATSAPAPRQPSNLAPNVPLGSSVSSSAVFVGASSASPIDPLPRPLESHDPAAIVTSDAPLCASLGNQQCCSRVSFEAVDSMQLNRSEALTSSSKMISRPSSDLALMAVWMLALTSAQWLTTLSTTLSSSFLTNAVNLTTTPQFTLVACT